MASKEVYVDILRTRLETLTGRERTFAEGIVKFYQYQGYLSEKQERGAQKLAVRIITERDAR